MKLFYFIVSIFLFLTNLTSADQHRTKFKDIKGYKEQFLSLSYKKTNRIKEVKKSDGFPVYDGKTSIQVTVNREDAGCGKGKSAKLQIGCDGKGNRSRQEIHLGDLRLKYKEYI